MARAALDQAGGQVHVPAAHVGGVEREGQAGTRRLQLARPVGDGALHRPGGGAQLILPAARLERGADRAQDRLRMERSFEQHDIAQRFHPSRRLRRAGRATAIGEQDEGQVGPAGLRGQRRGERAVVQPG
ncbi:hypothetical protein [Sphingomonas sp. SORGH_AS_0438]|uniref:hypothetical protein n=1 Tax=Sphingomonas sp. SORGH_AS_0438 TaxID=3041756 RepID=UPI00285F64FA|nr:hypothetical protein [Sphingomonas sp. SORGH_AS_0438]MDR6128397.1 hypothetical protein [Sphingomonas sp. SORGH_AS_0438]